jgi:hypothetical protein
MYIHVCFRDLQVTMAGLVRWALQVSREFLVWSGNPEVQDQE